jgi:hypothetical protein
MLAVRVFACDAPAPKCTPSIKLPKRLARLRRNVESKRIENFKKIQETIKTAAREERDAVRDFWRGFFDDEEDVQSEKDAETPETGEDLDE